MNFACEILADSTGAHGHRLTTFEVTFPRMVLPELTRHRMLSFSVESSRARPTEALIEQVRSNPYIPTFRERVKGMGGGKEIAGSEQRRLQWKWIEAAHSAATTAEQLLHTNKEHVNRLLEPFMWTSAIISGTEWANFFALRLAEDTQYELRRLAVLMFDAMDTSDPRMLKTGDWHLPLVDESDIFWNDPEQWKYWASVSAGRCARVSYARQDEHEETRKSAERWDRLAEANHWSPAEHPAMCVGDEHIGNFYGFQQLRKFYIYEDCPMDAPCLV